MMTKNQMNERNQLENLIIERQKASRDELSMLFSSESTPIGLAQSVLFSISFWCFYWFENR